MESKLDLIKIVGKLDLISVWYGSITRSQALIMMIRGLLIPIHLRLVDYTI